MALGSRSYILFQLREALLRLIIQERENIFDPQLPTTRHDGAVIHKLHTSHRLTKMKTVELRKLYEMPSVPLDKIADLYVSLAMEMFKNLDTVLSSDDEQDKREQMEEDDNDEDPDQGNTGAGSSAHTKPHEESPVQDNITGETEIPITTATGPVAASAAGQAAVTVEATATVDEAIRSVTESDLGDRSQAMDIDQSCGTKETIPETGHFSPSGHEATPSSSPSKAVSNPDVSPIMPTKEGTTGADPNKETALETQEKPTAEQQHSPTSSSNEHSGPHAQPDALTVGRS